MKKIIYLLSVFLLLSSCSDKNNKQKIKQQYPTVKESLGYYGSSPNQFSLEEYQSLLNKKMIFLENPLFSEKVAHRELPPVVQRLPDEPLIIKPYNEIGVYSKELKGTTFSDLSGNAETISWRQANLFKLAEDLRTVLPAVAKGCDWNNDFTELTIYLRKGHKWSDGQPFTVDDVIFWWEDIILNEEINSSFRYQWTRVEAPEELEKLDKVPHIPFLWRSGNKPFIIRKVNETTFTIKSENPFPNMLYALTDIKVRPFAPAHILKKLHIKYNSNANQIAKDKGFNKWSDYFNSTFNPVWDCTMNEPNFPTLNSHVIAEKPDMEKRIFKANPYFYILDTKGQQLPYIYNHIEYFSYNIDTINKLISEGLIDEKSQSLNFSKYDFYKKEESSGNYKTFTFDGGSSQTTMYAFNATHKDPVKREIFSDVRFRKAMSISLNREEMSELVFKGDTTPQQAGPNIETSFMHPDFAKKHIEFNTTEAERLLDEIGLKKNSFGWRTIPGTNKKLKIKYYYSQQGGPTQMHKLAKKYWENVGIQIELEQKQTEELRMILEANNHDLAVWQAVDFWEISLIKHPEYFIPPYNDTTPMVGIPWQVWYDSNGEKGIEPPAEVIRLFKLAEKAQSAVPGTEDYKKIFKEMAKINSENLWIIGTVGQSKRVMIVSNELGNFPENSRCTDFAYMLPYNPFQWFIK